MDGGFPDGGIGVPDTPAAGQARLEAAESSFRSAMSYYHMAEDDIDCMVEQALPDDVADPQLSWPGDELNEFANRCDVDFSDMYYMTD
jgi:hypothetical protein